MVGKVSIRGPVLVSTNFGRDKDSHEEAVARRDKSLALKFMSCNLIDKVSSGSPVLSPKWPVIAVRERIA